MSSVPQHTAGGPARRGDGDLSLRSGTGPPVSVVRLLLDSDTAWRERASCRHADANLFFPVGSTGAALVDIRAAQAMCRPCPVKVACLQFALDTNQEAGVWGGLDEQERRRLRASRRRRAQSSAVS